MHIASPLTKRQRSFQSKDHLVDKLARSFWRRLKSVSNIIIQAYGKINSPVTKMPRLVGDIILRGIPMNGKKLRSSSKLLLRSRSRRSRGFRTKCSGSGFSLRPSTKRRSLDTTYRRGCSSRAQTPTIQILSLWILVLIKGLCKLASWATAYTLRRAQSTLRGTMPTKNWMRMEQDLDSMASS
jgi:hypothetical protein